ncbi:MAG: hypothetical protein ACRD9S_20475, partial [Pyrinomonadaceae bacterium]
MRIRSFVPLALFLLVACQLNGAGKLPVASNARGSAPSAPPSASSPETARATTATFTDADFALHMERLKAEIRKKLTNPDPRTPAVECSLVIQRPFVVIGDETKQFVQERAEGTVKWAVDRLRQDFFPNDPKEILDIWLFKDAASYEKHTRLLFGETPTTPYGYYS